MRVRVTDVSSADANRLAALFRAAGHEVVEEDDADVTVDHRTIGEALARLVLRGRRPLVVPAREGRAARMCASILEAAGLEPGVFAPGEEPTVGLTRRKIVGGAAPAPPFVVGGAADVALFGGDAAKGAVLLVSSGADADEALVAAVPEEGLALCDASNVEATRRVSGARARVAIFGLEGDAGAVTPTWFGTPLPPDHQRGVRAFDLFAGGSSCGRFAIATTRADDVRDAVGAVAACAEGFGVGIEIARRALASLPHVGHLGAST